MWEEKSDLNQWIAQASDPSSFFFFFYLRGCPDQLARTTTNPTAHWTPYKPSEHVKYRGGNMRTHESSNPGAVEGDKPLPPPGQDPQRLRS